MKLISALILVCAFACVSAQFGAFIGYGVKGGSSGSRGGSFYPRLTPSPIQEKKEQLQVANVDEVDDGSSSVVVGGSGATGSTGNARGFVQLGGQQDNIVRTFVSERPTQQVLVPSSGSVSSLPLGYGVKGESSGSRGGPFYRRFKPTSDVKVQLQSPNVYGGPSIVDDSAGLVTGRVFGQPDVRSGPWSYGSLTSDRTTSVFGQRLPSYPSTGSGTLSPVSVGKVGRRHYVAPLQTSPTYSFNAPQTIVARPAPLQTPPSYSFNAPQTIVSRPAPLQTPPSYSFNSLPSYNLNTSPVRLSYPQLSSQLASFPVTRTVPTTQGYTSVPSVSTQGQLSNQAVPSVSAIVRPVPSLPAPARSFDVSPTIGSGEIFTDNKISSPGFSGLEPSLVISQEKQYSAPLQTSPTYSFNAPQTIVSRPAALQTPPSYSFNAPQTIVSRPAPLQTPPSYSFSSPQTIVSRPAPLQTPPSYNFNTSPARLSYPQLSSQLAPVSVTRQVPTTLTQGYTSIPSVSTQGQLSNQAVPSVSTIVRPVPLLPVPPRRVEVVPTIDSEEISTDNKISSPGLSGLSTPLKISQEKQSAEIVQTTEW